MFRLLLESLLEGLKDIRRKYVDSEMVPEDIFKKFETADPTSTKKYLDWMCRMYVQTPDRVTHIIDIIPIFDQKVKKQLLKGSDADIGKYKDLDSVDTALASKEGVKTKGEQHKEEKSGAEKVYEDDDLLIVSPETYESSRLYGAKTKWCTASNTREHWDSYYKRGVKLYYLVDKKNNEKFAAAMRPDPDDCDYFDAKDNSITFETLVKRLGDKGISKTELKKILQPLSDEQQLDRNQKAIQNILKSCTKNEDGTYSSTGDIAFFGFNLKKLPAKFKDVRGNFACHDNQITTLEGAPETVGGDFDCHYNKLTTLEGAPETVGKGFYCAFNKLTSLENSPEEIGRDFDCADNNLTSLEGGPQKVVGTFACHGNQLTSLKGAPQTVGKKFYCHDNQLITLEGAPEEVGEDFYCHNNPVSEEELKKTVKREYLK